MTLVIPPESTYSDAELRWLEAEAPVIQQLDQSTLWGQLRKVFADYMQTELWDRAAQINLNSDPATCDEDDIVNWEIQCGLPVNPGYPLAFRRALVQVRLERGAFTVPRRNRIIELFISATLGDPIVFTTAGVPFTSDGIPFFSGEFDVSTSYRVIEDVPNYAYAVYILNTVDVDLSLIQRELKRITPAPIDDGVTVEFVSSFDELYPDTALYPDTDLFPAGGEF